MKKFLDNKFLLAAVLILAGIFLCIFKDAVLQWIIIAAGALFVVQGVLDILRKMFTFGVIEMIVGLVMMAFGGFLLSVALYVIGGLLIAGGIFALIKAPKQGSSLVVSIGAIILGILLIVAQGTLMDWLFIVIGVVAIIYGIAMIISAFKK